MDVSYRYDDIGNRIEGGEGTAAQSDLSDLEETTYSSNALNQYTGYAWDGENRLVQMTTRSAAVLAGVPPLRLSTRAVAQKERAGAASLGLLDGKRAR